MVARFATLLIGAAAFWAPAVAIELATAPGYSIALVTLLPLACLLLALVALRRWRSWPKSGAFLMLAGIYLFGFTSICLANSHLGGAWTGPVWFVVISLVPPLTLIAAGYNGTVFGMLLATAILLWVGTKESPAASQLWRRYTGRPGSAEARPGARLS